MVQTETTKENGRSHTTALCSPTRMATLTGRNHHSVGFGSITELAIAAPGYNAIRPITAATIAETLRLNGYSTAQFGKCHEVPPWEASPIGPTVQLTRGLKKGETETMTVTAP